jgi:hypothetical protein
MLDEVDIDGCPREQASTQSGEELQCVNHEGFLLAFLTLDETVEKVIYSFRTLILRRTLRSNRTRWGLT